MKTMRKFAYCFFLLVLSLPALSVAAGQGQLRDLVAAPGLRPATAIGDVPAVALTGSTAAGRRVLVSLPAGSDARPLGPSGVGDDGAPCMVALPEGEFLVVAARWRANGAELWAQRGGTAGWRPARRLRHAGVSDHHPAVAAGRRTTWMVWVSEDANGTSFLVAAQWDGRRLSVPERLPSIGDSPGVPAIAVDAHEQPAVVWSAYDGTDTEVWISRRSDRGWSSPEPLTNNDVPDEFPDIGRGRAASLVVSWGGYSPTGYQPFATHELPDGAFAAAERLDNSASGVTSVLGGESDAIAWATVLPTTFELRVAARNPQGWQSAAHIGQVGSSRLSAALQGETLLASTDGGAYAVGRLRRSEATQHPGADLDLPSLPARSVVSAATLTLPGTYRAFGDSITQGVADDNGVPTLTEGYPAPLATYIADFLNRKLISMTNAGMGGETTTEGLGRLAGLNATSPKLYTFIMEGANDASVLVDENTVETNLRAMIRNTIAAGGLPIISTVTPRTNAGFLGGINPRITGYNDLIAPLAEQEGALLVDQYWAFFKQNQLYSDRIHPNPAGYAHMAATWFRGLQPLFAAILQGDDDEVAAARELARQRRARPGPGQ